MYAFTQPLRHVQGVSQCQLLSAAQLIYIYIYICVCVCVCVCSWAAVFHLNMFD